MKKILIVEDEPPYVKILKDRLTSQGHIVLDAQNGQIGLEKAIKERPDLILLDLRMPVMDGMTMLQRLRKNDWGKHANVVILTNMNDSVNISNTMNAKASRYIIKSDTSFNAFMSDIQILLHE